MAERTTRLWLALALLAVAMLRAAGPGALGQWPPLARAQTADLTPDPTPSAADANATSTPARPFVVAIDPGHGGTEVGAAHPSWEGAPPLREKDVNLAIALDLRDLLEARGYQVVMTRTMDTNVNVDGLDLNGDGVVNNDDDLQARVDIANQAHADVLVSIHNNGAADRSVRGTSVWYCADHPQGARARRLAQLLQQAFLAHLRGIGYSPLDQGANDDPPLHKPYGHLFVVGVKTPRVARPSEMPGVVGESLYVTNDREAALLAQEQVRQELAAAYRDAVVAFLEQPQ